MASSEGSWEFPGEYRAVFDAVCHAVQAERMTITAADPVQGLVSVSAPMSALSWGENAEIRVWQARPGVIGVGVHSKSKLGVVDWGRNQKNVQKVFTRVQDLLANPPGPPPAGWHPDPHGRHESRYWDGASWTEHVSTGGVVSTDPV